MRSLEIGIILFGLYVIFPRTTSAAGVDWFFTNQLAEDAHAMTETQIKDNDPIYLVFRINAPNVTLANFASYSETMHEKNVWLCVATSGTSYGCSGLFKGGISPEQEKLTSFIYTVIPATNDLKADNLDVVRSAVRGLSYAGQRELDLKILAANAPGVDPFPRVSVARDSEDDAHNKITILTEGTGRWRQYAAAIEWQDGQPARDYAAAAAARAAAQAAAQAAKDPLPETQMKDVVLQKGVTDLARQEFDGWQIYKVAIDQSDWTNIKHPNGYPSFRKADVSIMMKNAQSGQCVIENIMGISEDFDGMGYGPPKFRQRLRDDEAHQIPVPCEKFAGFHQH